MPLTAATPASALSRSTATARADLAARDAAVEPPPSAAELEARDVFQQFVAGTFFQQMFKALRKTQGKAHYLHGGKTEEIFQAQFDQHVSEELARRHGDALCRSLYEPFLEKLRARQTASPPAAAGRLSRLV